MYAWDFIQEIKHVRRAVSIHKWKTFVHSLDCADLKTLLSLAKYMYIQYIYYVYVDFTFLNINLLEYAGKMSFSCITFFIP
jgi:hypothetical protein